MNELADWKASRQEYGDNQVGPFVISFSGDHLHKANISGGAEYGLNASIPAVDPIVLYERRCFRFVAYILYSLSYAGFIGFDRYSEPNHPFVRDLLSKL